MPGEPSWWYRPEPTLTARLLTPLGHVWGRVAERRIARATPYRPRCLVICIGNFTAGGTGKTPMTRVVVRELRALGCEPVILTRGYGGRIAGPHFVDVARDSSADVGDEPLLHAQTAPVMVARDRAKGAAAIEAMAGAGGGVRVIVMDDGLQNPSVAKDLSFAVVDARRGLGNGLVMPAGPLRAPIEQQLGRVHAIVINRAMGDEATIPAWLQDRFAGPILMATTAPSGDCTWLKGVRVLAFAGIGAPERFFRLLSVLGAEVAATRVFPDHHAFGEGDAANLMQDAARFNTIPVTTEKDWVRLGGRGPACAALRQASRVLPIELKFDEADASRLAAICRGCDRSG